MVTSGSFCPSIALVGKEGDRNLAKTQRNDVALVHLARCLGPLESGIRIFPATSMEKESWDPA